MSSACAGLPADALPADAAIEQAETRMLAALTSVADAWAECVDDEKLKEKAGVDSLRAKTVTYAKMSSHWT